jgi:hypothetical protein
LSLARTCGAIEQERPDMLGEPLSN